MPGRNSPGDLSSNMIWITDIFPFLLITNLRVCEKSGAPDGPSHFCKNTKTNTDFVLAQSNGMQTSGLDLRHFVLGWVLYFLK